MAFSGNFMCTSFKKELLEGVHNFKTLAEARLSWPCTRIAPLLMPLPRRTQPATRLAGRVTPQVGNAYAGRPYNVGHHGLY